METDDSQNNKYYTKLILDAIANIKKLKKCPSDENICHLLRKHPDVPNNATAKYLLQKAVENGSVLPVFSHGKKSYLDPTKVSQLKKKTGLHIIPTKNLMKIVVHCIQTHRAANGCTLDTIEQSIRTKYRPHVKKNLALSSILKSQVKQAVRDGLLQQEGAFFKVAVTFPKKKPDLHSRIGRVPLDEEDTEAGPSKAFRPSERNQSTLKSNVRPTRSSRTKEVVNYAESSENSEESSSSSDTVATESSESDQQDSDGSNSEDEERYEKTAPPFQSSGEEDETERFTPGKKTALENLVDGALPSTSCALEKSAVQHERENSCRPASKSRLNDSDHQSPITSQAMDSDHATTPVGQTRSDASVEQLEAYSTSTWAGPSGALSPASSGDCDVQPLQHGATTASSRKRPADLSTTFGNGTARGRVENESHSALYSEYLNSKIRKNNLTIDKLQKEKEFWEERRRREKEFWEERRRREKEKEEREKEKEEREKKKEEKKEEREKEKEEREKKKQEKKEEREKEKEEREKKKEEKKEEREKEKEEREKKKEEKKEEREKEKEEREKKQHDLIVEKTQREIELVEERIKREQEKAEEEKERHRRMGEMSRREAEESKARQEWYERNAQH